MVASGRTSVEFHPGFASRRLGAARGSRRGKSVSSSSRATRTTGLWVAGLVAATSISALVSAGAPAALAADHPGSYGEQTSAPTSIGRAVGSNRWGYVGDVETRAPDDTVFNYGVGINPVTGALVVSDSGKVVYSRLGCALAGFPAGTTTCQLGTPRVFEYRTTSTDETARTDYTVDGTFVRTPAPDQTPGSNGGLGAIYQPLADRKVDALGAPATGHGPRGVTFTQDGTTWVVDSEATAPVDATPPVPGAVLRYGPGLTRLGAAGYTGAWGQKDNPLGVMFYRVSNATTPNNTVLVNSEVSDRVAEFNADGSFKRYLKLDLPAAEAQQQSGNPDDQGYRNPYGVSVDPVDGSMYISLINFRDDPTFSQSFIEKRDAEGNVLTLFGHDVLPTRQVIFGTAVDPATRHVFAWTADGKELYEFDQDGTPVDTFTPAQFPGLGTIRGVSFDRNNRMYVTVAEGTSNARVMIFGRTPDPMGQTCVRRSEDGTSATLTFDCGSDPTHSADGRPPAGQTPLLDYLVEQSNDGGETWQIVPKDSASTARTRTVTGLDPASEPLFRVSAWNEAGNGDWRVAGQAIAKDASAVTDPGQSVTLTPETNAPWSMSLVGTPGGAEARVTGGVFTLLDGGEVSFTPDPGFVGTATVDYLARWRPGGLGQRQQPSGPVDWRCEARATLTVVVGDPVTPTDPTSGPTDPTSGPTDPAAPIDDPTGGTDPTDHVPSTPTSSPAPPTSGPLPDTGSGAGMLGWLGLGATLLVGGAAALVMRRRSPARH